MGVDLIHWLTGLVLLLSLFMLLRPWLRSQVNMYIAQAAVVGLITVLVAAHLNQAQVWISAIVTLLVKVVAIPCGLLILVKKLDTTSKRPTVLNPAPLAIIAALLIGVAAYITEPLSHILAPDAKWQFVVALSLLFLGLLMIISQRAAFSQMIGFLVLENGVVLLAIATTLGWPAMVELGLLLDVAVGITILSILTARMSSTLHSTDTEQLSELKD